MFAPQVKGYGDYGVETFDQYYSRWPAALQNFPECVVKNWVYRHWQQFSDWWNGPSIAQFSFDRSTFDNFQITGIGHVDDWLDTLDYWGDELFQSRQRQSTWLGNYMLSNGTAPAPIIVATNAAGFEYPRGGTMKASQLVEGHMRLAYLRGMIRHKHSELKPAHSVWALTLPEDWLNHSRRR
jgi:hypothetical protein